MHTDDENDDLLDVGPEEDEPFLKAELDRALLPYKDLYTPEMAAYARELLAEFLTTHPVGRKLLDRARPRRPVQRSGPTPTPNSDDSSAEQAARHRSGNGRAG
jgi:hypothetical protein